MSWGGVPYFSTNPWPQVFNLWNARRDTDKLKTCPHGEAGYLDRRESHGPPLISFGVHSLKILPEHKDCTDVPVLVTL
jgi:hypothetical protein